MGNKPRGKMPVSERAKQFAPFSALRGLEEALELQEQLFVTANEPEHVTVDEAEYNERMLSLKMITRLEGDEDKLFY
ncbi:MAG: hypothetical protein K6F13_06700 [Lachnospiraceae bacterium]|nr:hypothetical protein [Lachnospiraceae bacterium]